MSQPVQTLQKVYGEGSLLHLMRAWSLEGEEAAAVLEEHFKDKRARQKALETLSEASRGLLAFLDKMDRRVRGERLKKRWFLHGYNDFEEALEPLIHMGLVIAGNTQAREAVPLELVLEQGFLQQWLQVTPGFEGLAGEPPAQREVVEHVEEETRVVLGRRAHVVELNLLHAWTFLLRHPLRLNRDGSAHRSDLKAMAPTLIDPSSGDEQSASPDPVRLDGWATTVFLLSMAEALGLVERRGDLLVAVESGSSYFRRGLSERLPLVHRALEQQRVWSELSCVQWYLSSEPPVTGQGDGGFQEVGHRGASLAGPRGSVMAALRRLQLADWFDIEETVKTIYSLENEYLRTSLPASPLGEVDVRAFVEGFVRHTLPQLGAAELGRGQESGTERARLTPFGKALIGLANRPEEPEGKNSVMVEPSLEITCFIDLAPIPLLYDLSRFAEIVRTSERVVRYRLHGESAQSGYALGYTAASILDILATHAPAAPPPTVEYHLHDWERLHRRVSIFLCGELIAAGPKGDPEVIQSGVTFAVDPREDVEVVSLDYTFTFVTEGHREALDRALTANHPLVIDYEGPIHASLRWHGDDRLLAPIGCTDLRLLARLQRFCRDLGDGIHQIDPARIHARFPKGEGFERLLALLRIGLVGGLSPERELALKRLLGRAAVASMQRLDVLLLGSDDDGDRVARAEAVQPMLAERLGPRAFAVKPGAERDLLDALGALGVDVPAGTL